MTIRLVARVNEVAEWGLESRIHRENPWQELAVTAKVTTPDGRILHVPAFWAGDSRWCIRFAPDVTGEHSISVEAAPADPGLHGATAVLVALENRSSNPLLRHGAIRVSRDRPTFEHQDGTPFLWFGDTWWMLMSDRVSFPEGFRALTADRHAKGFTVAQVVVGFPPDVTPFDGRDGNEGGSPWEAGYARINPTYFDFVDLRIAWLCRAGIVPCILGSWGYHVGFMGEERMQEHWRYLIARYAAYPVLWSIAGEGGMAYYLSQDREADSRKQLDTWSRVARNIRRLDPYRRPLTMHPRSQSWDDISEPDLLDFHMLQPGHMPHALGSGVKMIAEARDKFPTLPVVNAEPPYEGHMGTNGPDVQRYAFWSSMLSGAAGFTYGAAGIFQANDRDRPTGDRPDGGAFDATFWDDAIAFAGASQLAHSKAWLAALPFQRLVPDPQCVRVELRWGAELYHPPFQVFAARDGVDCVVAYLPLRYYHWDGPTVCGLAPGEPYEAQYLNPESFERYDLGSLNSDSSGHVALPGLPVLHDWVVVVRRATSSQASGSGDVDVDDPLREIQLSGQ